MTAMSLVPDATAFTVNSLEIATGISASLVCLLGEHTRFSVVLKVTYVHCYFVA
jgi:hypothetical protein